MQLYNTLTRRKEPFTPLEADHVRLYTCGPTVYNHAHIGNFRAYVFEDVLRRVLRLAGYRVTQVMNLTDVDDKTIRGARAAGLPLADFTRTFKEAFFADLRTLGIEPAEVYPAATEHIPEMIALIQTLLDRGVAYRSEDGSVYFSVARFPGYGKLAHLDLSGLRAGARVAQDEYEKEAFGDFALWKAWTPDDGDVAWDAPWGRGRPGWHVECSAMGMRYLGPTFDLHTGGIDNLFPHHENEVAQSEAATGKPFVKTWLHCAHLRVQGEKMSKSLGNFFTLRDLLSKGHTGREIRYVLLSGHYRQPLNFTFDALAAARAALARLDEFAARLLAAGADPAAATDEDAESAGVLPEWAGRGGQAFREAVFDDLNLPIALAALHGLVTDGNRAMDASGAAAPEATAALGVLRACDRVLNVLPPLVRGRDADAVPPEILALGEERAAARKAKDWAASDRLRDELAARGWDVRDTPQGQTLKPRRGPA